MDNSTSTSWDFLCQGPPTKLDRELELLLNAANEIGMRRMNDEIKMMCGIQNKASCIVHEVRYTEINSQMDVVVDNAKL